MLRFLNERIEDEKLYRLCRQFAKIFVIDKHVTGDDVKALIVDVAEHPGTHDPMAYTVTKMLIDAFAPLVSPSELHDTIAEYINNVVDKPVNESYADMPNSVMRKKMTKLFGGNDSIASDMVRLLDSWSYGMKDEIDLDDERTALDEIDDMGLLEDLEDYANTNDSRYCIFYRAKDYFMDE